ncbi:MAG: hypothetical protein HZA77_02120 [Candidatus Schekmanbacteria bacterium]|nr:hypothetical protein [Candidatus Schekmanbacteria bacterium]
MNIYNPVTITQKAIDEFKAIYKEEFGEELSDEDALENATSIIILFEALCAPASEKSVVNISENII